MAYDGDLVDGHPEQVVGLDDLQPLLIRVEELIADVAASVVTGQITTADLISRGDPSRRHRNR